MLNSYNNNVGSVTTGWILPTTHLCHCKLARILIVPRRTDCIFLIINTKHNNTDNKDIFM